MKTREQYVNTLTEAGFDKTQVNAILEVATSIANVIASEKMVEVARAARMGEIVR